MLILDAIVLPTMNIICISSTCCDLRFYEMSNCSGDAAKCNLRLYIRDFPSPLNSLYFHSCCDDEQHRHDDGLSDRLIVGDFVGSVRVIDFAKNFKSHFRMGSVIRQISYVELMKVCGKDTERDCDWN